MSFSKRGMQLQVKTLQVWLIVLNGISGMVAMFIRSVTITCGQVFKTKIRNVVDKRQHRPGIVSPAIVMMAVKWCCPPEPVEGYDKDASTGACTRSGRNTQHDRLCAIDFTTGATSPSGPPGTSG